MFWRVDNLILRDFLVCAARRLFGSLSYSMFTLFQFMTFDSWAVIARPKEMKQMNGNEWKLMEMTETMETSEMNRNEGRVKKVKGVKPRRAKLWIQCQKWEPRGQRPRITNSSMALKFRSSPLFLKVAWILICWYDLIRIHSHDLYHSLEVALRKGLKCDSMCFLHSSRPIIYEMPEAAVIFLLFMGIASIVLFNLMTAIVVKNAFDASEADEVQSWRISLSTK